MTAVRDGRDPAALDEAARLLQGGQVVAFPTETVYGLGAAALDGDAVARIFAAKERPADNPVIVHVADVAAARDVVGEFPRLAEEASRLWPGALTLVLRRGSRVPDIVTAGGPTVGVRVPAHPVALALLRRFGGPIAAPSANRSGRPSPTLARHVLADLAGRIELILDGGATEVGLESTVVDMTREVPLLLRRGGVTIERLREVLGRVDCLEGQDPEAVARSPGLRHRHYAPRARVVVVGEGEGEADGRTGLITRRAVSGEFVRVLPATAEGFAHGLFAALRELDELGLERIVVEGIAEVGLGAAIMDRLRRAAEG